MNPDIGAKIRELRLARSMTQEQLAQRLNLSAQAVSKWENGITMPDIQLLPELSVVFGVTIDELFSLSDEARFLRIEYMLESVRFMPDDEFSRTERYLRERRSEPEARSEATLLLAELYNKRAQEYRELAAPLAREALRLNPAEKAAHQAVFEAENGFFWDWCCGNHHALIEFYVDFVDKHPDDPKAMCWLTDLLIADGRTAEARAYVARMREIRDDYHYEWYMGHICKAECNLPEAMAWFERMTEHEPENWVVWSCMADELARQCRYDEAVACYRRSMGLRQPPRLYDDEESIAHICEIRGDYAGAIEMRRQILALLKSDWNVTEGEGVDIHLREIERLNRRLSEHSQGREA